MGAVPLVGRSGRIVSGRKRVTMEDKGTQWWEITYANETPWNGHNKAKG